MAVYTVTISTEGSSNAISLGDGSTYATLSVGLSRGPKGDGFTGGTYNASTGQVTFTSNDGIGFSTGDLRGDLTEPGPIGSVTPNTGEFTELDLAAIAATKADTAVDVFVYDTSKDSDGGAWRKRTQHTSWYNETLNTATRGSRREFPAVAVIVAEIGKVTIYDGDDPTLPMWMVFTNVGPGIRGFNASSTISAITMRNGLLASATAGATNEYQSGLPLVNFLSDRFSLIRGAAIGEVIIGNVEDRNSATSTAGDNSIRIASGYVNDVAMTVLPDAPIDPATGLPVPTIAVATDGGTSVIRDDGTVVDITGYIAAPSDIAFSNYKIITSGKFNQQVYISDIPTSDTTVDAFGTKLNSASNPPVFDNVTTSAVSETDGGFVRGTGAALDFLYDTTPDLVCRVTSTYNTGWMNGDIKGAFLSDTDDTDLVGSGELVTNGTFDADISGWTAASDGVITYDAGNNRLELTNGAASNGVASQAITTVIGETYVVTATVAAGTSATPRFGVGTGNANASTLHNIKYIQGSGDVSITFVATTTTTYVGLSVNSITSGLDCFLDNVSVKLADADRSVNNNGLIVNGTVTRSPVATGADLVAYSGFSGSNYLSQPFNADLDFGTGDFCVMGWVTYGSGGHVFERIKPDDTGNYIRIIKSGNVLNARAYASSASTVIGTRNINDSSYHHFAYIRSGGVESLYVDGSLDASVSQAADNISANDQVLFVGIDGALGSPDTGSLALLRISATAPTAEQIAKIYEDEKFLFQENAQATLYGSSDAVTALWSDPVTDLLHVKAGGYRNEFQGLSRVAFAPATTGSSISAVGGLVVEG